MQRRGRVILAVGDWKMGNDEAIRDTGGDAGDGNIEVERGGERR